MALDFKNDATILWLLRNSEFVYRTISAQAAKDTTGDGLATVRTAEDVRHDMESLVELLGNDVSSLGELVHDMQMSITGSYGEGEETELSRQYDTAIIAKADQIVEHSQRVTSIVNDLINYKEIINGEIRRGYLTDPDDGSTVYGIAISSSLSFTGTERSDLDNSGATYYELSSGQTLGMYTSTGWSYWIDGKKVGWFSSTGKELNTPSQTIQKNLTLNKWLLTDPGSGFGVKYVGGST